MASLGESDEMQALRRRYKILALVCLFGDLVVIAAFWMSRVLEQDLLVMISAVLIASGLSVCVLFIKVLPDAIARMKVPR